MLLMVLMALVAVSYVLYFKTLVSAGASNLLLVIFLILVSAIFLGTLVLEEAIHLPLILGRFIITLG